MNKVARTTIIAMSAVALVGCAGMKSLANKVNPFANKPVIEERLSVQRCDKKDCSTIAVGKLKPRAADSEDKITKRLETDADKATVAKIAKATGSLGCKEDLRIIVEKVQIGEKGEKDEVLGRDILEINGPCAPEKQAVKEVKKATTAQKKDTKKAVQEAAPTKK